jgi:ribonucleoside-triphosphate reductase
MNEACLNLFGKNLGDDRSKAFAIRVMDFMRDKLLEFSKETGNNYNLEATPAEGTSHRLAAIDKEQFYDIICANEDDYWEGSAPYYSNSTQLPVDYTDDIFEVLDLQDDLQTKYTGGTVVHIFAGERVNNTGSLKKLVRTVCETYKLPYFTFTPTFSICPSCGYISGEHAKCPTCGSECEVYSRVVGYLRPVNQWNEGKQAEFKNRKVYSV